MVLSFVGIAHANCSGEHQSQKLPEAWADRLVSSSQALSWNQFLTIANTAPWNGRAGSLPSFHQEPFWHGTMNRWAVEQFLSSDCPQAALDSA